MRERIKGYLAIAFIIICTGFFTVMTLRNMQENPQSPYGGLIELKKD